MKNDIQKSVLKIFATIFMVASSFSTFQITHAGTKNTSALTTSPQASLLLQNDDMNFCHVNTTDWSLSNNGVVSGNNVNWTIYVTKEETSPSFIISNGYISVTNSGDGPAYLLNIIANLQRKLGKYWVTQSSDIITSALGNNATIVNICKTASSEGLTSFSKNIASGMLTLTDATDNSAFSLVPQMTIPSGETVKLLYSASFNNSVLNIAESEDIRMPVKS